MKQRILRASLAAALWLAGTSGVRAEATATDPVPPAASAPDVQDLLFLGDERPILIRLHVQVDGKGFTAAFDDYLRALIQYMDRDNDGMLNEAEAKFLPNAAMMAQVQQNGYFIGQPNNYAKFADLRNDPQATKVSFEDLSAYYRKGGVGMIRVTGPQQNIGRPANGLTDALFKALDTNGDGKISKAEMQAAERTLMKLDADDDETISGAEILGVAVAQQQFSRMAQPATPLPLVGIDARGDLTAVGRRIVSHYDRDRNQKLNREEIGIDAATFEKLDLNRDGVLDATEVLGLLRQDAAVELTVRLGKVELDQKGVQSVRPPAANLRATAEGMVVTLGNTQVDFGRTEAAAINIYRQFYLQQFRAIDKKKQGFLVAADFDNGQIQFIKPLLPLIDRDGDGKVTEKELTDYLDLQARVTTTAFSIQVAEGGQGLFELLDADRDGRLSVKELRTAWDRLAAWDRNSDGCLARSEIPRQMEVTVTRGAAAFGRIRMVMMRPANNPQPRGPGKGPLWFRKMDRNNDGVLSPREFIGTAEDFKKLDTDGDGFIDAAEAEKAAEVLGKRADAKP